MRFSSRLYRPLYIWLSHSCSSFSHTAYLSSRFFVTSTKNFRSYRREVHRIQSANATFPSMTMFSDSQFKRSLSYNAELSVENHEFTDAVDYHRTPHWKLKICGREKNISTSLCRTRPVYSNQIDSEKKLQLGILYNQQRKKREKDVLSPTSFGTASELASNGIHLDALTRRLKEEREHFDGSGYEKSSLGKNFEERKETEVDKVRATGETGGDLANVKSATIKAEVTETHIDPISVCQTDLIKRLSSIYGEVRVVDNISAAKEVVRVLTDRYRHLVHACDTEVCEIDVKQETPVDHGEIICFSIYSGLDADFGNGKSCIWVDVLDGGGRDLLVEFAPFFEDPSIKKVWHNYSFDNHVIENYGIKVSGFHADTMHMARLWDSSRSTKGGYSLEALTSDQKVMSKENLIGKMSKKTVSSRRKVKKDGSEYKIIATPMVNKENLIGKVSKKDGSEGKVIAAPLVNKENLVGKVAMKTIFGRKKLKKDGTEGKIITIPPVEELQRKERTPWICYSVLDSISTLQLYESLKSKLEMMSWNLEGVQTGTMFNFYETYWRPFGEILVKMETEGILVDRAYLAEIEEVAIAEQQVAANRFRNWASTYCADAQCMNLGSGAQLRQLFFAGTKNRKDPDECLPVERTFKVPNIDKVFEKGKKTPTKFRSILLKSLGVEIDTELYTGTGWPSVSKVALKTLAGKVSAEYDFTVHDDDALEFPPCDDVGNNCENMDDEVSVTQKTTGSRDIDTSSYGTAYAAFGGGQEGREACHAIASLCEVCSIDSLLSNFIRPLQGSHTSGRNGRVHCSLNINTETGRLSARRPNLQNQPALEKDLYKIRRAFVAAPSKSLIVADYGQLELRILAHLTNCKSMLDAFKAGGDFHSRTAMNMYPYIHEAVKQNQVLLEWYPQPGEDKPPVSLLKDVFAPERRKAKMLNFSIAYGRTPEGLAKALKVPVEEAKETVDLWYSERKEVLNWQEERKKEAHQNNCVHTLLGRTRRFPSLDGVPRYTRGHIERAAINTPVQGSAADVAMCAMLEISRNERLKELEWRLLLQIHDEVILEGPTESAEVAEAIVADCMSNPFNGQNILRVELPVDVKIAQNWYSAK